MPRHLPHMPPGTASASTSATFTYPNAPITTSGTTAATIRHFAAATTTSSSNAAATATTESATAVPKWV
jgi:hypothetical protein